MDLGSPVNCLNLDGLTPLYLAVSTPGKIDPEIVEILLRDHAQHGVRDASGSTELHQVCGLHRLVKFHTVIISLTTYRSDAKQLALHNRQTCCLASPVQALAQQNSFTAHFVIFPKSLFLLHVCYTLWCSTSYYVLCSVGLSFNFYWKENPYSN